MVEGVRGQWRVDPAQLGQPFAGRAALLSPFDRLLADRKRMDEVFEFDYILEMYKPAGAADAGATTRCRSCTATGWSGSSTPRPTARRACSGSPPSTEDVPFTKAMTAAVDREIADLARWLDLELGPARLSRPAGSYAGRECAAWCSTCGRCQVTRAGGHPHGDRATADLVHGVAQVALVEEHLDRGRTCVGESPGSRN